MTQSKIIIATLLLSLATGCTVDRKGDAKWQDPFFPSDDKKSSVDLMLAHTQAKGAAADGTLHASHFDGDELNGLGNHKLAQIVKGRQQNVPVTVYVNAPDEPERAARRVAMVEAALGKLGVHGSDGQIEVGPNPKAGTSAAKAMKVLQGDSAAAAAAAPAPVAP